MPIRVSRAQRNRRRQRIAAKQHSQHHSDFQCGIDEGISRLRPVVTKLADSLRSVVQAGLVDGGLRSDAVAALAQADCAINPR